MQRTAATIVSSSLLRRSYKQELCRLGSYHTQVFSHPAHNELSLVVTGVAQEGVSKGYCRKACGVCVPGSKYEGASMLVLNPCTWGGHLIIKADQANSRMRELAATTQRGSTHWSIGHWWQGPNVLHPFTICISIFACTHASHVHSTMRPDYAFPLFRMQS